MAAKIPLFNVLADPTDDARGHSLKVMAVLVLASSHGGVGLLSYDLSSSKVLIRS